MKKKLLITLSLIITVNLFAQRPILHQWSFENNLNDSGTGTNTPLQLVQNSASSVTYVNDALGNANSAISLSNGAILGTHLNSNPPQFMSVGAPDGNTYYSYLLGFDIKTGTNDSQDRIIFSNQRNSTTAGFYLYLIDGKIRLEADVEYGNVLALQPIGHGTHPTQIDDNFWHRVVIQVQYNRIASTGKYSNVIRIYIDGSVHNILNLQNTSIAQKMGRFIEPESRFVVASTNALDLNFFQYQDTIDNIEILNPDASTGTVSSDFYQVKSRPATTLYVNENATGLNNGSSWTDAYTSLAVALGNSVMDDEIWVARGSYSPGSNRTNQFRLRDNVKIYGGFIGTETMLSERDFITNETILTGDVNGDDSQIIGDGLDFTGGTRSDNNYTVVSAGENNIIDGFTIRDGQANDTGSFSDLTSGAAIYATTTTTNLTVKNCKILNNVNYIAGSITTKLSVNNSKLTIENCEFAGNLSRYGAGLSVFNESNVNNTGMFVNVTNSLFHNNKTDPLNGQVSYSGSSIYITTLSPNISKSVVFTMVNSTLVNNEESATDTSTPILAPIALREVESMHTIRARIYNSIITGNIKATDSQTKPLKTLSSLNVSNKIFDLALTYSKVDETSSSGSLSAAFAHMVEASKFQQFANLDSGTNVAFKNPANNDFSLAATDTPLIDQAFNFNIPSGVTTDLAGNPRIVNSIVDMGAYEYDSTLSITEYDNSSVTIYPNPVVNILNVNSKTPISSLSVFDLNGKKVKSISKTNNLDVSDLAHGLYILEVQDISGNKVTKKFIK